MSTTANATLLLHHESDTRAFAHRLADTLRLGHVVTLSGPLGAGKSALARALIRHLLGDPDAEVPSPTFTLLQTYALTDGELAEGELRHYDLYRLTSPDEVLELGWDEAPDRTVTLVEWPDRLGTLMPCHRLDVRIELLPGDARRLHLIAEGADWSSRLEGLIGR